MTWDQRGFYFRSRYDHGQRVREYYGRGPEAKLAAVVDELGRAEADASARARRRELDALAEADTPLDALVDLTDVLYRAALYAAGFHQHARGHWRAWSRATREEP